MSLVNIGRFILATGAGGHGTRETRGKHKDSLLKVEGAGYTLYYDRITP